jgi:hypothetical protein
VCLSRRARGGAYHAPRLTGRSGAAAERGAAQTVHLKKHEEQHVNELTSPAVVVQAEADLNNLASQIREKHAGCEEAVRPEPKAEKPPEAQEPPALKTAPGKPRSAATKPTEPAEHDPRAWLRMSEPELRRLAGGMGIDVGQVMAEAERESVFNWAGRFPAAAGVIEGEKRRALAEAIAKKHAEAQTPENPPEPPEPPAAPPEASAAEKAREAHSEAFDEAPSSKRAAQQAPAPATDQPGATATADVARPSHDDRCKQRVPGERSRHEGHPVEIHEAAGLFPLDEASLPELADDIRRRGLLESVKLFDGKVLDGRRRLRACELAGVQPRFEHVATDDPIAYAWSLNGPRRHMTPSEKAMAGAKMRAIYDRQAKERQKEAAVKAGKASGVSRRGEANVPVNLPEGSSASGDSRDKVGRLVGVSGKTIDFATKVIEQGVPELVKSVESGCMAVSTAAAIADEDAETQRARVAEKRERKANPAPRPPKRKQPAAAATSNPTLSAGLPGGRGKLGTVGVHYANEAINCLLQIRRDDPQRQMAGQIITEWATRNLCGSAPERPCKRIETQLDSVYDYAETLDDLEELTLLVEKVEAKAARLRGLLNRDRKQK